MCQSGGAYVPRGTFNHAIELFGWFIPKVLMVVSKANVSALLIFPILIAYNEAFSVIFVFFCFVF